MKTRTLGKSGFEVSEVGLGCWQLGGDFGALSASRSTEILNAAQDSDVNFWDTADVYGMGLSESRISEFLYAYKPRVIVATKVGRDSGLYPDQYTRERVRANIAGSAIRLGVETIDLVQLHCVPLSVLKAGDILEWMEDFRKDGLIRAFGASVESAQEAVAAMAHPGLTSLQIIFNIFRQNPVRDVFPLALENDVGIIVRLPLASGVLSGKMSKDQEFSESDHRHYNRNGEFFSQGETFSGVPFESAVEFADEIRNWCPRGMSMAQMAMRWILDYPAVSTIITGASRPEQVIENASVSGLEALPAELHEKLADYYRTRVEPTIVVPV